MESSTLIDAWLKLRRIFGRRPTLVSEKEEGREKTRPRIKARLVWLWVRSMAVYEFQPCRVRVLPPIFPFDLEP